MYGHYFTIVSLSPPPPTIPEETWLVYTYPGFQGYLSLIWMVSRKKLQLTSLIASCLIYSVHYSEKTAEIPTGFDAHPKQGAEIQSPL